MTSTVELYDKAIISRQPNFDERKTRSEFRKVIPNRAENSHQPTRRRERKMQGFKISACSSPEHLQRPAPSHLSKNAPSLQGIGHAYMARSRRCGVSLTGQEICCVHYLAM
jgi:transposase-like protein